MILITGCGRSGTVYISKLLRQLGRQVGHERIAPDGAVGWFYAADEQWHGYGKRGSRISNSWDCILHQVRHPLKVISSTTWMHDPQWAFINRQIRLPPRTDLRLVAATYWLRWNLLAESVSDWTYRIEGIRAGTETFSEWCQRVDIEEPPVFPNISRTTNRRCDHRQYGWDDFNDAPKLKAQIQDAARRWGYVI